MNFYNEIDPKAAAWLRELIAGGHIPAGVVDERSITEIEADELTRFTQCHFFAGIGGWPLALAIAGWEPSRPVWTGSCPCQPFSAAGQGKGASDDRHLWPVFRRLIAKLHPERVFGEQVAQAIGFNWLDGVSADLEADGYAVGAAVLGAHSVGAPHIRQRLFWVADSNRGRCEQRDPRQRAIPIAAKNGATGGMGDSERQGLERLAGDGRNGNQPGRIDPQPLGHAATASESLRLGDTAGGGCGILWDEAQPGSGRHAIGTSWARFEIVHCRDGKARRFEPGSFPLADGLPGRVGLLRGYGNAIVPQTAAEFVMAFDDIHTANADVLAPAG